MTDSPLTDLKTTLGVLVLFATFCNKPKLSQSLETNANKITPQEQIIQFDYQGTNGNVDLYEYSGASGLNLQGIASSFNDWDNSNGDIYSELICRDIFAEIHEGQRAQDCSTIDILGEGYFSITIQ